MFYAYIEKPEDLDRLYREIAERTEQYGYKVIWESEGKESGELSKAEALQYLQDLQIYYYLKYRE